MYDNPNLYQRDEHESPGANKGDSPEWEQGFNIPSLIPFITYEQTFLIVYLAILASRVQVCWVILFPSRESQRHSSGRINVPKDDVRKCVSDFITGVPRLNNSRSIINPRHRYRRTLSCHVNCISYRIDL